MQSWRQCLVTRKSFAKPLLLRLVKLEHQLRVDLAQTLPGRGYYLSVAALKLERKNFKALLQKRLKVSCSDAELDHIIACLKERESDVKA
ncbi:YlxR family protein [Mycoplasmoides pneumoniae]|uniref:Transcription termination protein n=1 Tax=Mycoplasmoides pneumoniae TaxID=2104 RepID=A0AB38W8E2_MYCPM|nr:YlxR family protein [Mycoplasmoides pneumoniae]ALA30997.1 hypothetical protein B434_02410 [Mycoplasmoides pneumoniae 19294]AGC04081.1 hypothetical protein C985_0154 [Mycoplasmoides pneumoniae M129-B7]ALA30039.1 hypothetical protein C897_00915 [Mycoplasmoides pneumoniae PI 1428]ALA31437.1 hypothetical protein F536_00885 [Mycoplasmoides pneumoniae 39443]ALA32153.1 hypothetical protein F533_00920 [Mycoplasmoides pneumoniae 51494]